uniref:rRNA methyltransferase 2, mitochondrial n=1 Tax=Lactuca sativa TaxID=4236 RepID=A0A9R1VUV9_LACSA|nr:hypothetical protein LSAT_V11C400216990 [Lactuca sativa]
MSGSGTADFFYREAQRLGYVARSAFKFSFNYGWNLEVQLLQIQKQYKLITPGSSVVDLGCAPGYFGNKVKNSMAVVVGWFLLTQISRHRFKKMGGFTRIKYFFNCTGRKKSEGIFGIYKFFDEFYAWFDMRGSGSFETILIL